MLSLEMADLAHGLSIWCQMRSKAELDPALQAEYRTWAEWFENSALAVRLEVEFLRLLWGPDGRISECDQALLEESSRFTMQAMNQNQAEADTSD